MDLASILVCGLSFVVGDRIDVTHLLRLRVTLESAIAFCAEAENKCTPGVLERIEQFEACESDHVEALLGLAAPVDRVVIQEGDRFYIRR